MKIDIDKYMQQVKNGYVSMQVHPENSNIVIFNYTPEAVYNRHWNGVTLKSRGLIVDITTGEVMALPFDKFFNYGEMQGAKIRKVKPETTIKKDGSLGISYKFNGRIRWATRGSFVSEQSKVAQEIWDKKYADKAPSYLDEITLLVEIIHPKTRVVVNYRFEDLVLIGARNLIDGDDYSHDKLVEIGKDLGMPVTEKVEGTLKEFLEIAKTLTANEEGFVLRWRDGYRLKVKGDKYLEVHRILYGLSLKQKIKSWAEGTIDELIIQMPEEFRGEIEKTVTSCNTVFDKLKTYIFACYKNTPKKNRKIFAGWVNTHVDAPFRSFMFAIYDGQDIDQNIKEFICKNYKNYGLGD